MELAMKSADNTGQLLVSQEYNMVASEIQNRILTIRGTQVLLDRDLAELYGVSTSALNQSVKRNINRFPERFMFQLSDDEFRKWKSQFVISNSSEATIRLGLRKRPFVFTEHGVAMLASVLRSKTAACVSLAIIDAFVAMRRFLLANVEVFKRIETIERRQIANQAYNEERFQKVFKALDEKKEKVQGVFYDGQLWDACSLVEKLIGRARVSLLLIDNWIGPGTLDMVAKKAPGVSVVVVTSSRGNQLAPSDIEKFNAQYPTLDVRTSMAFHDRFLIIDDKELYLIGASLKDLGKKCFGFTKMDPQEIPHLKGKAFNGTT
ncbi:MAG: ORF6N domain-containing protein [Victivallales bacterium]|nr:ORF6N domain-containing protein [Victivallales bacterium]